MSVHPFPRAAAAPQQLPLDLIDYAFVLGHTQVCVKHLVRRWLSAHELGIDRDDVLRGSLADLLEIRGGIDLLIAEAEGAGAE